MNILRRSVSLELNHRVDSIVATLVRLLFAFPLTLPCDPINLSNELGEGTTSMNDNTGKIIIQGAREHNLRGINLDIPRGRLVVITGVSGSGKSSLAFDTLYAEGQRRYVESLSAYARQFLGQMEKPQVDYISGLSPAISIEQKTAGHNPRSTVGTITEIYDYLRVLFARTGTQHCPDCGNPITTQSAEQMVEAILGYADQTRIMIAAPVVQNRKGEHRDVIEKAQRDGFVRARINGDILDLDSTIELDKKKKHTIDIIIDRLVIKPDIRTRLTDSVETALKVSAGILRVIVIGGEEQLFSENAACISCGLSLPPMSPQRFSFNSPLGMCPVCGGLGTHLYPDPELLIKDESLSLAQGAVKFIGNIEQNPMGWNIRKLRVMAAELDFKLETPWKKLPELVRQIILNGGRDLKRQEGRSTAKVSISWPGILPEIERLYLQTKSEGMRKWYGQFISNITCPECKGTRLSREARSVLFHGRSIVDLSSMSIQNLLLWIQALELASVEQKIAGEIFKEICNRLHFLKDVGLHYLTLDRQAPTLSGGEAQRIRLASQIGSGLVGVMYILDEPSIGLHSRDTSRLLGTLGKLRDIGNSVIVVEHDLETIRRADYVIDMGPGAGHEGGLVVASGTFQDLLENEASLTGSYLSGRLKIEIPKHRRNGTGKKIRIIGATEHNLKNITVDIPLGRFVCVTGVSGSGKSTLINHILFRAVASSLYGSIRKIGRHRRIEGVEHIDRLIEITQQPIGRTPRSNPATYTNVFTQIRTIFAQLPEAKLRGYNPGRFSFNVKGGRCEACQGDGVKRIEMHFLPDVFVTCEVCKGRRFNQETLEVKFRGLSISDVLDLEVRQAIEHFAKVPSIVKVLNTLHDVGLDYIKLGQPAPTLSGGEAQRVKLSRELAKHETGKTLYILDEPTTGLHSHDILKLLTVLHRLVDLGNTVLVIEHNLDVVKNADWIIDLGPEGGDEGGALIATGTPESIIRCKESHTGRFLDPVLSR